MPGFTGTPSLQWTPYSIHTTLSDRWKILLSSRHTGTRHGTRHGPRPLKQARWATCQGTSCSTVWWMIPAHIFLSRRKPDGSLCGWQSPGSRPGCGSVGWLAGYEGLWQGKGLEVWRSRTDPLVGNLVIGVSDPKRWTCSGPSWPDVSSSWANEYPSLDSVHLSAPSTCLKQFSLCFFHKPGAQAPDSMYPLWAEHQSTGVIGKKQKKHRWKAAG